MMTGYVDSNALKQEEIKRQEGGCISKDVRPPPGAGPLDGSRPRGDVCLACLDGEGFWEALPTCQQDLLSPQDHCSFSYH